MSSKKTPAFTRANGRGQVRFKASTAKGRGSKHVSIFVSIYSLNSLLWAHGSHYLNTVFFNDFYFVKKLGRLQEPP
jgi:hypothetical protein